MPEYDKFHMVLGCVLNWTCYMPLVSDQILMILFLLQQKNFPEDFKPSSRYVRVLLKCLNFILNIVGLFYNHLWRYLIHVGVLFVLSGVLPITFFRNPSKVVKHLLEHIWTKNNLFDRKKIFGYWKPLLPRVDLKR